jgi:hypothetical protein
VLLNGLTSGAPLFEHGAASIPGNEKIPGARPAETSGGIQKYSGKGHSK